MFLGRNPNGKTPKLDVREGPMGQDAWAREVSRLAGIVAGNAGPGGFDRRPQPVDYYDVKGALEELFLRTGLPVGASGAAVEFAPTDSRYPFLHPRARAEIWVNRDGVRSWIGVVGELHPDLVDKAELRTKAVVFELDVDALARSVPTRPQAQALPRFPAVRRDFALVVDDKLPSAELCDRMTQNEAVRGLLKDIEIFDIYRGGHVPAGKKSIALSIVLRAPDRTLTDDEVVKVSEALIADLRTALGAEIRA